MEQTKKRFRPTLTQYRALEMEIAELKDKNRELSDHNNRLARQVESYENESVELGVYKALEEHAKSLNQENTVIKAEMDSLKANTETLEKSNKFLEDELQRVRKNVKGACDDYNMARREVIWLLGRNLWERITNKRFRKEED